MEKLNKRILDSNSGKSFKLKQCNLKESEVRNKNKNLNEIEGSQWKMFDETNNTWKILETPKLNKEGQLYIDKLNKKSEAIIEEE